MFSKLSGIAARIQGSQQLCAIGIRLLDRPIQLQLSANIGLYKRQCLGFRQTVLGDMNDAEQADAEARGKNDPGLQEGDEEEASDLPTVIKLARKRPLNFACMLSDASVVLVTHRRKNWGILVKQASSIVGIQKTKRM